MTPRAKRQWFRVRVQFTDSGGRLRTELSVPLSEYDAGRILREYTNIGHRAQIVTSAPPQPALTKRSLEAKQEPLLDEKWFERKKGGCR